MSIISKRLIIIVFAAIFALGCSDDSGGSTFADPDPGPGPGNNPGAIPIPVIIQPSPCMRIAGNMNVTVTATDDIGVVLIYILLNDVVKAIITPPQFSVRILTPDLPPDGTYLLEAIAFDGDGNFGSYSSEVRIDNDFPFENNYLVVDPDADPFDLGEPVGAIFRINTETGNVCPIASSTQFVDPVSIVLEPDGTILVSDRSADLNGIDLPGTGALFRVDPEFLNSITPVLTHPDFRMPAGLDVAGNTIYMADTEANPAGITLGPGETAPGAIFGINMINNEVTTLATDAIFEAPAGVLVEPDGSMWIVDEDAQVFGWPRGALFYYNYNGALEIAGVNGGTLTPYEAIKDPTGGIIFTDAGDITYGKDGRLWKVDTSNSDPKTAVTTLVYGPPLVSPSGIMRTSTGVYLIADRDHLAGVGTGAIIQYDPGATPELSLKYTSKYFVQPYDIIESTK